jgi:hypothetical protein
MPFQSIQTCPECSRPFLIVWNDEAAPRRLELVQCPNLVDGEECCGMLEADVPAEAVALPSPRLPT